MIPKPSPFPSPKGSLAEFAAVLAVASGPVRPMHFYEGADPIRGRVDVVNALHYLRHLIDLKVVRPDLSGGVVAYSMTDDAKAFWSERNGTPEDILNAWKEARNVKEAGTADNH